jgi:PAS domain S-box-containing protein
MVKNSGVGAMKNRIAELEKQLAGQHEYEKRLKTSEAAFNSVIDNIPDIVYSLGQDTNVLNVNIPSASKFGYTSDEIIGKSFADFIHPDDRERIAASFIEAIETQRQWTRGCSFA